MCRVDELNMKPDNCSYFPHVFVQRCREYLFDKMPVCQDFEIFLSKNFSECLQGMEKTSTFATAIEKDGGIAQLVRAHDS